jgi:hypothetical protein
MAIKRIDIVEQLSGRGIVFEKDGEELGEADYEIDVLQTIIDVGTICTPDRPRAARNTLPSKCNVNLVMLRSARCEEVGIWFA